VTVVLNRAVKENTFLFTGVQPAPQIWGSPVGITFTALLIIKLRTIIINIITIIASTLFPIPTKL